MKRFIQTLQVAIFLLMISMPMLVQAGTITSLTNTPYYIDIAENSKVRFTYKADILPLNQQTLVFLECDATGRIVGNSIATFSGYGSGTCCTTLSTGKAAVLLYGSSGGTYTIQYYADSPLAVNGDLGVAGNENVYGKLTVMDKLGVGTATPGAGLHVTQTSNFNGNNIAAIFGSAINHWTYFGGTTGGRIRGSNEGYLVVGSNPNGTGDKKLYLNYDSPGNIIMGLGGGNVGIGTVTPNSKLVVAEGVDAMSMNSSSLGFNRNVSEGTIFNTSKSAWQFTARNERFSLEGYNGAFLNPLNILKNGNIGIGTINPQATLQIGNSISNVGIQTVRISTPSGEAGSVVNALHIDCGNDGNYDRGVAIALGLQNLGYGTYTSRIVHYGNVSGTRSSKLQLQTHAGADNVWNTGILIDENGYVGIGTTTPDALLSVKGTIHAMEVVVDLCPGLADFVFHPSYSLMPLHEVEQYVKTNSHLPEIPSAAEVSKNGMSIGEMQNKLLQKIEELTLYVIEQQKQIDLLKQGQK